MDAKVRQRGLDFLAFIVLPLHLRAGARITFPVQVQIYRKMVFGYIYRYTQNVIPGTSADVPGIKKQYLLNKSWQHIIEPIAGEPAIYRRFASRFKNLLPMITIISGTNRPDSRTLLFATRFLEQVSEMEEDVQLLDLAEVKPEWFIPAMYDAKAMAPELVDLQQRFVLNAKAFVIFVPEYNGSYPGILKLFIDGISVNQYPINFKNKVIALVGVASGRAGNLRGMDHLADTIAHMGGWVLPNKLPLSGVEALLNDSGKVSDQATIDAFTSHAEQLIAARNRNLIYK